MFNFQTSDLKDELIQIQVVADGAVTSEPTSGPTSNLIVSYDVNDKASFSLTAENILTALGKGADQARQLIASNNLAGLSKLLGDALSGAGAAVFQQEFPLPTLRPTFVLTRPPGDTANNGYLITMRATVEYDRNPPGLFEFETNNSFVKANGKSGRFGKFSIGQDGAGLVPSLTATTFVRSSGSVRVAGNLKLSVQSTGKFAELAKALVTGFRASLRILEIELEITEIVDPKKIAETQAEYASFEQIEKLSDPNVRALLQLLTQGPLFMDTPRALDLERSKDPVPSFDGFLGFNGLIAPPGLMQPSPVPGSTPISIAPSVSGLPTSLTR